MELFTKKRVLLLLVVLTSFVVVYYILQSHWDYTKQVAQHEAQIKSQVKRAKPCEQYKAISKCERCPRQELRDLVGYCMETGFKEKIECADGKQDFIWCDISPAVEETDFWKFQALMLFFGLSSYSVVYLRQRKLDKILMDKIHKQIASGL